MKLPHRLPLLALLWLFLLPGIATAQTSSDWYMAGANPQRTSWVSEEVRGRLNFEWYKTFDPFIPAKVQIVAAYDTLFISTAKGLYALSTIDMDGDGHSGDLSWVYPTKLPLGHSPTITNGIVYVGGLDGFVHAIEANPDPSVLPLDPVTGYRINDKVLWKFQSQEDNQRIGAGFETNPVIANDTVYIGNRNGYMYAINTLNGELRWKYPTNGSISFSPAYKKGVVYFASNDGHAYAVSASTGSLLWQSVLLPGCGFNSYWPVIYTHPETGKDYIIYGGCNDYVQGGDLWVGMLNNKLDGDALYPGRPQGGYLGPLGYEPGDWAANTRTIDASRTTQYFEINPTPSLSDPDREILYKQARRRYFVLDALTGTEYTYDSDGDGLPEYAPISWAWTHGGNRYPAVVGSDGVLYQHTSYISDPYIPRGGLVGWKFGTKYISLVHEGNYGAVDEPIAFSAGGNVVHWGWFSGREGMGAYDITLPYGTPSRRWEYYLNKAIYTICPGSSDQWDGIDNRSKYTASQSLGLNSSIGAYGLHGTQNAPVPYKGKLYFQVTNTVYAMTPNTTTPFKSSFTRIVNLESPALLPSKDALKQELAKQVRKMVEVGHLRPGFPYVGLAGYHLQPSRMSYLLSYFHNPGETLATLIQALPHLPSDLQQQTRIYLQNEFNTYGNRVHIGWNQGTARESFLTPPEIQTRMDNFNPVSSIYQSSWDLRYGLYGKWKYVQEFDTPQNGLAEQVFTSISNLAPIIPPESDLVDPNSTYLPYVKNAFIAGYMGYIGIGELAGYPKTSTQLSPYVAELDRLMVERASEMTVEEPVIIGNGAILNVARNFMYMTPELGEYLYDHSPNLIKDAVDRYDKVAPHWFVANFDQTIGEGTHQVLFDRNAIFMAKAYALAEPYQDLVKYLDVPAFERGDLFYIQNLVAAIEAHSSSAFNPDLNSDTVIDYSDYSLFLPSFNSLFSIFDFNHLVDWFGRVLP